MCGAQTVASPGNAVPQQTPAAHQAQTPVTAPPQTPSAAESTQQPQPQSPPPYTAPSLHTPQRDTQGPQQPGSLLRAAFRPACRAAVSRPGSPSPTSSDQPSRPPAHRTRRYPGPTPRASISGRSSPLAPQAVSPLGDGVQGASRSQATPRAEGFGPLQASPIRLIAPYRAAPCARRAHRQLRSHRHPHPRRQALPQPSGCHRPRRREQPRRGSQPLRPPPRRYRPPPRPRRRQPARHRPNHCPNRSRRRQHHQPAPQHFRHHHRRVPRRGQRHRPLAGHPNGQYNPAEPQR